MPISHQTHRKNIGNYNNTYDEYIKDQTLSRQWRKGLAFHADNTLKGSKLSAVLYSLLIISNSIPPFPRPPALKDAARTPDGGGPAGRLMATGSAIPARWPAAVKIIKNHDRPRRLPLPDSRENLSYSVSATRAGKKKRMGRATPATAETRFRRMAADSAINHATPFAMPTAVTGTPFAMPAAVTGALSWPPAIAALSTEAGPVTVPQTNDNGANPFSTAPPSAPLPTGTRTKAVRPARIRRARQAMHLKQLLIDNKMWFSDKGDDASALINGAVDFIVTKRDGLSKVVRQLIKPSGEYGGHDGEILSWDSQFTLVSNWLEGMIFHNSVGEFIGRAIVQAAADNGCHAGRPLQLSIDMINALITDRLDGKASHPPSRDDFPLSLSDAAKHYVLHEVVLPALPILGLPKTASADKPVYIGTLAWGWLHAGLVLHRQQAVSNQTLSLAEFTLLGGSLEDMLREGAVEPRLVMLYELPATLFYIKTLAEQGIAPAVEDCFFSDNVKKKALEAYLAASSQDKAEKNPYRQFAAALQRYRTRKELAQTLSAPVVPTGNVAGNVPPAGHSRFCAPPAPGHAGQAADANRLFKQQNEDIAAKYAVVDGLMIALVLAEYDAEETSFLLSAEIYRISADFSAFGNFRYHPAARLIPPHAYSIPLAPHVDLMIAVRDGDKRIYALRQNSRGYVLQRVDYQESLYYDMMTDGEKCARDKDYKLRVFDYRRNPQWLKRDGETLEHLVDRLSLKHRGVFLAHLHEQGYEETTAEKARRFLLSLIPFYDCVNDIMAGESTAVLSCALDILNLLPLAGQGLALGARFAKTGLGGGLLAYRTTMGLLAGRETLRAALQQGGNEFVRHAILPAAEELNRQALIKLGIAAVRSADPGLEFLGLLGRGTIRQLVTAAKVVQDMIPAWKKLIPGLESGMAQQIAKNLPGPIRTGRLAGYHKDLPIIRLGGDRVRNQPVYARIDPETGNVFGIKYTLSPEGTLRPVPLPLAKRLKNVLVVGLSGRGAVRRTAAVRPLPVAVDNLLRWLDNESSATPLDRRGFLAQLGISELHWQHYVAQTGELTAESQRLLARAGVFDGNRLLGLPSELQQQIIGYLDIRALQRLLHSFPAFGSVHPRISSLRALAAERLGMLKDQYHALCQLWAAEARPGEKRWLASLRLNNYLSYGCNHINLAGLRLTGLPARLPDFINQLDLSGNRLAVITPPLPKDLAQLDVRSNCLLSLPDRLPERLIRLEAQVNMLAWLPDILPSTLTQLDVSYNRLMALPALPETLTYLDASHNFLHVLPSPLPPGLQCLKINSNRLSALPPRLPGTLIWLSVSKNRLWQLPADLSPSLTMIHADNNRLRSLPEILPHRLSLLDVSHNHLITLPEFLPPALTQLRVDHNILRSLPEVLPPNLVKIQASRNRLEWLPVNLPLTLTFLSANDNVLQFLPGYLPSRLVALKVNDNHLESLPENLPDSLKTIQVAHNPIKMLPASLPASLSTIDVSHTEVRSRPQTLPARVKFICRPLP